MGIGNTTSAAALAAGLLGRDPAELCGPGAAGLDSDGVARKAAVVVRMLERDAPDPTDPLGVLAAVGGFESAFSSVALEAAAGRSVVVLDGFITGAAALRRASARARAPRVPRRLAPVGEAGASASSSGHLASRPARARPAAWGRSGDTRAADPGGGARRLVDMATFADAGVTDTGR